jgi:hypothetical protein
MIFRPILMKGNKRLALLASLNVHLRFPFRAAAVSPTISPDGILTNQSYRAL